MDEDMKLYVKKAVKNTFFIILIGLFIISIIYLFNKEPTEIKTETQSPLLIPQSDLSPQIQWNGEKLIDSTVRVDADCYAQRNGMRIYVSPCDAHDVDGKDIQQDVNFTWLGASPQNVGWIFAYEGDLIDGKVEVDRMVTRQLKQTRYTNNWIDNYLIMNVAGYIDMGTPTAFCNLGNSNNTQMYAVTFVNGTTKNVCFTTRTVINSTAFRISGNYDAGEDYWINRTTTEKVDVTDRFIKIANPFFDNKSYYKVDEVTFNPSQSIYTHWTFTPRNQERFGKWHILGYDADIGIVQSVIEDRYIYMDPTWDASWTKKVKLNVNTTDGYMANRSVLIRVPFDSDMQSEFGDIRFVNGSENAEMGYWKYNNTCVASTYCDFWVLFPQNWSSAENQTIYVYYGNAGASTTSDITKAFWFGDDFGTLGLGTKWKTGTSASYSADTFNGMTILNVTGGAVGDEIQTYPYFSSGYKLEIRTMGAPAFNYDLYASFTENTNNTLTGNDLAEMGSANDQLVVRMNDVAVIGGKAIGEWMRLEGSITVSGNSLSNISSDTRVQNVSKSGNPARRSGYIGLLNYQTPKRLYVDWIYVRRYTPVEPTYTFGTEESSLGISISQDTPTGFQTTNPSVTLKCNFTATGSQNLSSVYLEVMNATMGKAYTNLTTSINAQSFNASWTTTPLNDGSFNWSCFGYGTGGINASTTNRTFSVHTVSPLIYGLNNVTDLSTISLPINSTLYLNVTDTFLSACWYYTSDNATNTTITCNSTFKIAWFTGGTKTIYAYSNDTFGNYNSTTSTFNLYDFNITTLENGDPIAEGSSASLSLLVNSTSFAIGNAEASIKYNNTFYNPTSETAIGTNAILFTYTFPIIAGMGNSSGVTYYYNWTYNATNLLTQTTPTTSLTIISFDIDDCSIYNTVIANFSLKDEESAGSFANSTGTHLEIETLTTLGGSEWNFYQEWTNVSSVVLCVPSGVLNNSNFTIDITAEFSASNHVTEFWYLENGSLVKNSCNFNSYTSCNVSLYDLLTADSTTFLFEFTDADGLIVDDAIIHTFRKYIGDGLFREVERSKQDNNGQTHVHLVEEDVIYYFMISQHGTIIYTSDTYNAKCLSSPCEISLSASASQQNWSIIDNEGGRYRISTDKNTRITTLSFNLDTSDLVNVSLFEYNGGTATLVNTTSVTSMSGNLPLHVPLSYGNKTFFVAIYNDNQLVKSQWIDLTDRSQDYFGTTGAILGGLIVLAMMLMAVSEGVGFIIFTSLALIIVGVMKLVDLTWLAIISIICAGGIIVWKLTNRRNKQG